VKEPADVHTGATGTQAMHELMKADLVQNAMKSGPEYIHDLWNTMFNDEEHSSRRIASVSIEFLNHPERYLPSTLHTL
jgi:hypothetical protein